MYMKANDIKERHTNAVGERSKIKINTGERMRRSLTITAENDKKILLARGLFLNDVDQPIDIDYTTMVNCFIDLGHRLFYSIRKDDAQVAVQKSEIFSTVTKYLYSMQELKEEAAADQFTDVFYKRLLEQWRQTSPKSEKPS